MTTVQVNIEGRNYSLQVNESDAHSWNHLADEVNEILKSIHSTYPQKDRQDCMAMAILTIAAKLYEARNEVMSSEIHQRLEGMNSTLTAALN